MQGAFDVAVHAALLHVRVQRGFFQVQHRGEAGVAAFEQDAPLGLGAAGE